MEWFGKMTLYALLAITVENMILVGGIGVSRVLRAARKPKAMFSYAFLVGIFTLLSSLMAIGVGGLIPATRPLAMYRSLFFALGTAVLYLTAAFIYKTWWPKRYKKIEPVLASSAINCLVLAMPFVQQALRLDPWQSVGFALGTAFSFFLAVLVLSRVMERVWAPEMPKAFQGLPAIFIYIGILSMALFGMAGGRMF